MSPRTRSAKATATRTSDPANRYDAFYFTHYRHLGKEPYDRIPLWLNFFAGVADKIVKEFEPRSVLDAGCAMGFLVEALRDRGVEAFGFDISPYAIERVRADVRQNCWVGSVGEALPRDYDLIVCIEVLEHVETEVADRALDEFCAHTGDIIFSSTPEDFEEATHINVRPQERWAEAFAQRGFFHDLETDLRYIGDHTARYRRRTEPLARIVADYERAYWRLRQETLGARRAAMQSESQLNVIPELERRLREAELDLEKAQAELRQIKASKAYRVASGMSSVARSAAPRGTRRGELFDGVVHGIRKKE